MLNSYKSFDSHGPTIMRLTNWSASVTERNRYVVETITANCILLWHLSYSCMGKDLEKQFECHRIDLMKKGAVLYADAEVWHGTLLNKCVVFVDDTKVKNKRHTWDALLQRDVFSGHKRIHCLVFQKLNIADGLIFHMYGPFEVPHGDRYMYRYYNMDKWLRENFVITRVQYYIMETK